MIHDARERASRNYVRGTSRPSGGQHVALDVHQQRFRGVQQIVHAQRGSLLVRTGTEVQLTFCNGTISDQTH